ncbi:MAG TPA: hypothetical protein VK808_08945, partial [Bacteroidia bacterium]|nr:hypothetical protein [Bacteroidia bacterium]
MKINIGIILILLAGLTTKGQDSPALANSHPALNSSGNAKVFASPGCVELGGSFSFTSQSFSNPNGGGSTPSTSLILFAPYVGYFPIQGLELGVNPLSVSSSSDGTGDHTTSLLFVFAPSYNFNTRSIAYPFIEGNIGYASISESGSTTSISGVAYGVR